MAPLALAQQADWQPLTLDAHQNETVVILTDLLIPDTDTPGAKKANVNRYIDLFLTDGPDQQRELFVGGLAWLDNFSAVAHGKPFRNLTREQQTAILQQASDGVAPQGLTEFFRGLKSIASRIYYHTAIGYQELNKGGRVPKSFACKA